MALKVAFQMDPIERIDIKGDSTFALLLEAQRRGHSRTPLGEPRRDASLVDAVHAVGHARSCLPRATGGRRRWAA